MIKKFYYIFLRIYKYIIIDNWKRKYGCNQPKQLIAKLKCQSKTLGNI
jgi:hypothetical protein